MKCTTSSIPQTCARWDFLSLWSKRSWSASALLDGLSNMIQSLYWSNFFLEDESNSDATAGLLLIAIREPHFLIDLVIAESVLAHSGAELCSLLRSISSQHTLWSVKWWRILTRPGKVHWLASTSSRKQRSSSRRSAHHMTPLLYLVFVGGKRSEWKYPSRQLRNFFFILYPWRW